MTDNNFKPLSMIGSNFNVVDMDKFRSGIELIKESLAPSIRDTLFASDNLLTWNRNLSFLREDYFLGILRGKNADVIEKSTVWRLYILLYFARYASSLEGDYVELGCYKGHTAHHVVNHVDFERLKKSYYLYDLFAWSEGDKHTHLEAHDDEDMYDRVVEHFREFDFVTVTKGSVPESLDVCFPERIAFAHIDMNHPHPESTALAMVLPRLSSGGCIIFDDYGWYGYHAQKIALDPIVREYGDLSILELPTGQGLLIKP
jgi:hypothetical protein